MQSVEDIINKRSTENGILTGKSTDNEAFGFLKMK